MAIKFKTYANRGMGLEHEIETINEIYQRKRMLTVQKIPTPTHNLNGKIWRDKSTVDFIGVIIGKAVAFDCKEIKTPSLPFSNIKPHQMGFLLNFEEAGGIGFFLIAFSRQKKTVIVNASDLNAFMKSTSKKSISATEALSIGVLVKNSDYVMALMDIETMMKMRKKYRSGG